jgi:hypothetical protein
LLGLLLRLLFLGGELFPLVLFPRRFVSHVSAPAAREIGVATETNARTDRWWAPRHSDRPVKPTLLRQATRISTEKSTRRPADLDEVTVGIAEEHADLVVCQNSAESRDALSASLRAGVWRKWRRTHVSPAPPVENQSVRFVIICVALRAASIPTSASRDNEGLYWDMPTSVGKAGRAHPTQKSLGMSSYGTVWR